MRELKRLFLAVLALTFLGGIGTGAWIGSLTAGPGTEVSTADDRADEFEKRFGLDATQMRLLRAVLAEHDGRIRNIQLQVTKEQFRQKLAQEELSRQKIRQILTTKQREEYDKLLGRG